MTKRLDRRSACAILLAGIAVAIGCQAEDNDDSTALGPIGAGGQRVTLETQAYIPVGGTGTVPPYITGDFVNRCTNCRMDAIRLIRCQCEGKSSKAELPCGYLTVLNGNLACAGMPKGSYAQTCRDCSVSNDGSSVYLGCECKDVNGTWTRSSPLRIPPTGCANVSNNNGSLICAPWEVDFGACQFASGSYALSCGACSMTCGNRTTMTCQCAPTNTPDTVEPTLCANNEVANRGGDLQCE